MLKGHVMLSTSSDVALELSRLLQRTITIENWTGVAPTPTLLILGWVVGFEPSATGTTMQTRMRSMCTQASKTRLSGPCD